MNTCVVALLAAAAVVVVSEAFSLESLVSKMMAESDDADTLERYRRDVNCSDHSQFGGPREFKKCCKKIPKIFRGGPPKHCHKSKGGPHHKGAPPGGPDGGPPPPSAPEKQMEGAGSPPPHRGPPDMDMHICKTEESFKNKSLINDDTGKVEIERVRIYMEEKLQDKSAEWKAPVDVALTKCEVEASKMVESGNHTCKSGAQELKICMERELFVNCPESFWKGGEKCEKSKEYLRNCPMPHPLTTVDLTTADHPTVDHLPVDHPQGLVKKRKAAAYLETKLTPNVTVISVNICYLCNISIFDVSSQ